VGKKFLKMSLAQFNAENNTPSPKVRTGDRLSVKQLNEIRLSSLSMANGKPEVKRSKYGAKKTEVDGILFDSILEAKRYSQLKLWQKAGVISDLRLQVPYVLTVNEMSVGKYLADFVYNKDGVEVIEDSKGFLTKEYKLKKKLMKAIYGIEIYESATHLG
jgi:hypothetical protein